MYCHLFVLKMLFSKLIATASQFQFRRDLHSVKRAKYLEHVISVHVWVSYPSPNFGACIGPTKIPEMVPQNYAGPCNTTK